jgi:hypothetical protein
MRYKSPIEIREIKKDLNLSISFRNRLFKNRLNFARIHRNIVEEWAEPPNHKERRVAR